MIHTPLERREAAMNSGTNAVAAIRYLVEQISGGGDERPEEGVFDCLRCAVKVAEWALAELDDLTEPLADAARRAS